MLLGAVLVGLLALAPTAISFGGNPDGMGLAFPETTAWSRTGEGEGSHPTLLIVEVLPHAPRDDEYVVLGNPGAETVNGLGWTLTDGEGSWTLPSLAVAAGTVILVTRNGSALWGDAGLRAEACVRGCDRPLATQGSLALRNAGDGLQLLDPEGRVADAFLYGEEAPLHGWMGDPVRGLGRGLVARRQMAEEGWLDTDTAADWAWNRTFRLGQSRRPAASFDSVSVWPLLSPHDSLEGLLGLLGSARTRIQLAGFTLTNPALAGALRDALRRGVGVQIGVEASPPGGIGSGGELILEDLARGGARVLGMGSHDETGWRRYALHHAKYVVVDATWVVLGSENFSPNGYPAGAGNRGWNVAAKGPALADWFREVWSEDWDANRSDVRPLGGTVRLVGDGVTPPPARPWPSSLPLANVTALLGPDNAATEDGLLGILSRARESIDVELFYLRWTWRESLNPLVAGILDAAARGVIVRFLLDGTSYNTDGDEDNDEAVRHLNQLAMERRLPLEARLFYGDPQGVVKLHNKGVLVDGRVVWVSSMNWNPAGAYANREAGLLVDSPEVASVFEDAFEEDWTAGLALGAASSWDGSGRAAFLWIGLGSGAAAGAWWWVLRTRKEPTNKHRRKAKTWRRRSKQPNSPSRQPRSKSTRIARSTGGSTDRAWGPKGTRR